MFFHKVQDRKHLLFDEGNGDLLRKIEGTAIAADPRSDENSIMTEQD